MAPALKVLSGKEVGTKAWADKMRKRAVDVSSGLETGYMELAEVLYNLFDVPIDGDPANGPWYKTWGYKTIGEFAEKELNIQRRKAEYLRGIWYRMEVELSDMDPQVKQRLVDLGWAKLRELVKVITMKTASKWADTAEKCNYQMLCATIQKYQDDVRAAQEAKGKGESYSTPKITKENESQYAGIPSEVGASWGSGGSSAPVSDTAEPDEELDNIPVAPKTSAKNFVFFPDQLEIVEAALKRAAELSNSSYNSHNLTVICQDFLATNLFGKPGEEQMIRFLTKYEELFNVRLVVIDKDDDPIYGITHLEELSAKLGTK